jgi:hypothetical protein
VRRLFAVGIVVAACYSPQPQPGSPCSAGNPCPDPLVCSSLTMTCIKPGTIEPDAATPIDAPADAFVPAIDAPAGPSNDLPTNPTVLTGAATITEDLTYAQDDQGPTPNGNGCGVAGGKDVFFEVDLTGADIWYFDTFGSNFPTVIRAYAGPCTGGPAPQGATCNITACNLQHSQLALSLGAGKSCIVVDQNGASANSSLHFHVEHAGRSGTRLGAGTATTTGTTCGFTNKSTGTCGGDGFDRMYFTLGCPTTTTMLTASTCDVGTTYDSVLYVLGPTSTELGCNDNDAACVATTSGGSTVTGIGLSGGHLFQLVVDGAVTAGCGTYSLTTTLQ